MSFLKDDSNCLKKKKKLRFACFTQDKKQDSSFDATFLSWFVLMFYLTEEFSHLLSFEQYFLKCSQLY